MRRELKRHGVHRRGPFYLVPIAALLFGAGVAGAADTTPVVTHQDEAMTFPHVRVVNAPQPATASATAAGQPGLRAYRDPETGALRPPTPEELAKERLEAPRAAQQAQPQVAPRFHPATGAVGIHLGDTQMVHTVVVQKPECAELVEVCLAGSENVETPPPSTPQRQGERNDR